MPTELHRQLVVDGPRAALAAFRDDDAVWEVRPWREWFTLHLDEDGPDRLVYRYIEDHKRPAPSTEAQSAAHPELLFTLEYCDEFGSKAGRTRYKGGKALTNETLEALSLSWMEWEDAE